MAAVPKRDAAAPESHKTRRKLPFHTLRGLTLTQEEADQLDPGLSRPQDKEIGEARSARRRATARSR
jgi:hypothetical protein